MNLQYFYIVWFQSFLLKEVYFLEDLTFSVTAQTNTLLQEKEVNNINLEVNNFVNITPVALILLRKLKNSKHPHFFLEKKKSKTQISNNCQYYSVR